MIQTVISAEQVRKQTTDGESASHLAQACRNIQALHDRGVDVIPHTYHDGAITLPFIHHPTAEEVLIECIRAKNINDAKNW